MFFCHRRQAQKHKKAFISEASINIFTFRDFKLHLSFCLARVHTVPLFIYRQNSMEIAFVFFPRL
jgi:hypothetical protein